MSKRSLEEEELSTSKKKRGRPKNLHVGGDIKYFQLDVIDDGGTVFKIVEHKLKRRGKIEKYIVGQRGAEFKVRLTIHYDGWKIHRWDFFHATLYIDGKKVRTRFIQKPENIGEEAVYVWDNNQEGYAFKFARRNTGRMDFSSQEDSDCGVICVELRAAERLDYHHRERLRRYSSRSIPIRRQFQSARNVHMSDATKEKHTVLRTVEGRRVFWLPESGSHSGPPPAKTVSEYVYANLNLFYDEAKHLEYRGVLKPAFCKEHRIYFPTRDFRKLKQLRRERAKSRPVVGDLTGDRILWRRERQELRSSEDESTVVSEDWESVRDNEE